MVSTRVSAASFTKASGSERSEAWEKTLYSQTHVGLLGVPGGPDPVIEDDHGSAILGAGRGSQSDRLEEVSGAIGTDGCRRSHCADNHDGLAALEGNVHCGKRRRQLACREASRWYRRRTEEGSLFQSVSTVSDDKSISGRVGSTEKLVRELGQ